MSTPRVSDRVAQLLAGAKHIVDADATLAQNEKEIKHLKAKIGRLEERLSDKNDRLRHSRKLHERYNHLKGVMVRTLEEKHKRDEKDEKKVAEKVDAEGTRVKDELIASSKAKLEEWNAAENADDAQFREDEKQYDEVFTAECAKIGKRMREQHADLPRLMGGASEQSRKSTGLADADSEDEDDKPPAKQAKKQAKEAEPHPGTLGIKAPAVSRPKGGKAVAKPAAAKPAAAKPTAGKGKKPAAPKGKKEQKGPRNCYAIWMGHPATQERYARLTEEVMKRGDEAEIAAWPSPIKDWYTDEWNDRTSDEVKARFKVMAADEKKEWEAKGWVRPARATKKEGKPKAGKKQQREDEEEEDNESDDDGQAEMEVEDESEAEAMDDEEDSDGDEAAKKAVAVSTKKSTKDKEEKKDEKKDEKKAEKKPEPDSDAGSDGSDDDEADKKEEEEEEEESESDESASR